MGSYAEQTNLLEYLRSKSQVDCDSLDTDRKIIEFSLYPLSPYSTDAVLTDLVQHSRQTVGKICRFDFQPGKSHGFEDVRTSTASFAGDESTLIPENLSLGRCIPRAYRTPQGGDTQKLRRACPAMAVRIQWCHV